MSNPSPNPTASAGKNIHIIVAAGSGSRYGGNLPKQFCLLQNRPLLMTTLERLHRYTPDWELIVVLSRDMTEEWAEMCREHNFTLPHRTVTGGATRAHSVKNAIDSLDSSAYGLISVHDAARPVITRSLIANLLESLQEADGVIPSCPVTDSIRIVNADGSSKAVDRKLYRSVQTPQIFPADRLTEAYRQELRPEFTDEASIMEAAGFSNLRLTEGDPHNIKVTNPGDMAVAELYLSLDN